MNTDFQVGAVSTDDKDLRKFRMILRIGDEAVAGFDTNIDESDRNLALMAHRWGNDFKIPNDRWDNLYLAMTKTRDEERRKYHASCRQIQQYITTVPTMHGGTDLPDT